MPLPEEYMTFQVAFVGSDGVVIGSHRRTLAKSNLQPTELVKFKKHKSWPVVCFCAGGADCAKQARATYCMPSRIGMLTQYGGI
jgi:20S proteasome alpha/beta subunit